MIELLDHCIDEFYITGQGRVIHWACDWSAQAPSKTASLEALNGLAAAHMRAGCDSYAN